MTTVLLLRHGRTAANTAGVLAGWTPGVRLDEVGRQQARALGGRLAGVPLAAVVTSPLERCRATAREVLRGRDPAPPTRVDAAVGECRYGDWTGRTLADLAGEPAWRVVQAHPSAAVFPGGEPLAAMAARAVAAVRRWNAALGPDAVYAVVSHGDVIKAVLADALGMHLDAFQRIHVDPCSVSAVRYTELRPFVLRVNDTGGTGGLVPAPGSAGGSDAAVGGGAGPAPGGAAPAGPAAAGPAAAGPAAAGAGDAPGAGPGAG